MTETAIVMLIVAIVVIAIVVALAVALSRRTRLRALPEESRDRYARSWHDVENQFLDDPTGAVDEADRIAVMILGERGATLSDPKTEPAELRKARDLAGSDKGRQGTEGMRQALVHYKRIVEDSVGSPRMERDYYRREVAS